MNSARSESHAFATALIATTLVVVGFVAYVRWSAPVARVAGMDAPGARSLHHANSAPGSEHPRQSPKRAAIATVYACEEGGHKVFSDQPCAADARIREVMAPNAMRAPPPSGPRSTPSGAYAARPITSSGSADSAARSKQSLCKSIDDRIDSINARMRHSYSAPEGERFRERLRRLDDERWDARCRIP